MIKTKTMFLLSGLVVAALLVTLTGCGSKTNTENFSIRPANEASEEGSAEETTATATPTSTVTPTVTPTATPAAQCEFESPEANATTNHEQILLYYFANLQNKDFPQAYGYLDEASQAKYGSVAEYQAQMEQKFKCLRAISLTNLPQGGKCPLVSASLGIQCFSVVFEATKPDGTKTTQPGISAEYRVQSDPHGDKSTAPEGQITEL